MSDAVHVHLRVGAERYALPVEDVRSIVELESLTPVPGTPRAVLGVRALDGVLLPVLDLAALLGIAGAAPTRIVVVDGDDAVGLAVDGVLDVAELPDLDTSAASDRLHGTALIDGALVGAIDVRAVLAGLEAELVS